MLDICDVVPILVYMDATKNTNKGDNMDDKTTARFLEYADDAANWNGEPLVGGNVGGDMHDCGYLLNMKKRGLLVTFHDDGCRWIQFTQKGRDMARDNGIIID